MNLPDPIAAKYTNVAAPVFQHLELLKAPTIFCPASTVPIVAASHPVPLPLPASARWPHRRHSSCSAPLPLSPCFMAAGVPRGHAAGGTAFLLSPTTLWRAPSPGGGRRSHGPPRPARPGGRCARAPTRPRAAAAAASGRVDGDTPHPSPPPSPPPPPPPRTARASPPAAPSTGIVTLAVCGGPTCAAAGGRTTRDVLTALADGAGGGDGCGGGGDVSGGWSLAVERTGCLGGCGKGPNAVLIPAGVLLTGLSSTRTAVAAVGAAAAAAATAASAAAASTKASSDGDDAPRAPATVAAGGGTSGDAPPLPPGVNPVVAAALAAKDAGNRALVRGRPAEALPHYATAAAGLRAAAAAAAPVAVATTVDAAAAATSSPTTVNPSATLADAVTDGSASPTPFPPDGANGRAPPHLRRLLGGVLANASRAALEAGDEAAAAAAAADATAVAPRLAAGWVRLGDAAVAGGTSGDGGRVAAEAAAREAWTVAAELDPADDRVRKRLRGLGGGRWRPW